MRIVSSFKDFIGESVDSNELAGIAIVWKKQVLLVRSAKSGDYGIPKGHVKVGEDIMDAAIREVKEEIGLTINFEMLNGDVHTSPIYDAGGRVESMLVYYILKIDSPAEIGMNSHEINKSELQSEEIDWAGFIPAMDAYPLVHKSQMIILDKII